MPIVPPPSPAIAVAAAVPPPQEEGAPLPPTDRVVENVGGGEGEPPATSG